MNIGCQSNFILLLFKLLLIFFKFFQLFSFHKIITFIIKFFLVRQFSFNELKDIQKEHIKVKHIRFDSLKLPQEYLGSKQFTNRFSSLLFNLRCQSVKDVKANFNNLYEANTQCHFNCLNQEDSQEHMLNCHELTKHLEPDHLDLLKNIEYNDLLGSTTKPLRITQMYLILLKTRERLLGKNQEPACHGNSNGHSG